MKFNIESPFFQFMNTLATFIGLNVLFLILCLPIITIGPALKALYTVTMQEARKDHKAIFSTFFRAFKENFFASAGTFLLYLGLALVFLFNAFFWGGQGSIIGTIFLIVFILALIVLALSFLYIFPLMARFDNGLRQTVKNSIFIPLLHSKETLGIVAIQIATLTLCVFVPQMKIFMILLGFSFIALCNSYLFIRVFSCYEEEQTGIPAM
ncbi:MAG: DUF624 domain-containing protein [Clostridiales bacterium]|nr:DUF624 domain-containing protein [Clostridiales bacterium]